MEIQQVIGKTPLPMEFSFAPPRIQLRPLVHTNKDDMAMYRKSADVSEKFRQKLFQNYIAKETAFMDVNNVSNVDGNVLELDDLPRDANGNASLSDTFRTLKDKKLTRNDMLRVLVAETLRRKPVTGVSAETIAGLAQFLRQLKHDYPDVDNEAREELFREELSDVASDAVEDDETDSDYYSSEPDHLEAIDRKMEQILEIMQTVMQIAQERQQSSDENEANREHLEHRVDQLEGEYVGEEDVKNIVKKELESHAPKAEEDEVVVVPDKKTSPVKTALKDLKQKAARKEPAPKAPAPAPKRGRPKKDPTPGHKAADITGFHDGKKTGEGVMCYDDPVQLASRLEVLVGEFNAGNTSKAMKNDIFAIADVLLKKKLLTNNTYKAIYARVRP